jgi:dTDP-4-amino-4,6-dideoxygalactose transaminase
VHITVTKPFLPPMAHYNAQIEGIWSREWLTNNGPLVNELELELKERLDLRHLLFVTNGTIALQLAIKALKLEGEVITTPFSFVATTSSLVWENCTPVMVDICPRTLNIDASKIEAAITERTTGIMATHVFGNPCDIDAIDRISKRHNLKVIYDAAHAFGSRYKGKTVFDFGNVSACSFHATKLFHTTEGGAVITPDPDTLRELAMMRNFGHVNPAEFGGVGINGKNSEFHAAMGLCNLPYVDEILERRKSIYERYVAKLEGVNVELQHAQPGADCNYAYFPVVVESEEVLLRVIQEMNDHRIFPRRYFYPSLSNLSYVGKQHTPICDSLACRIMCLPVYHTLSDSEIDMICRVLQRALNYSATTAIDKTPLEV